MLRLPGGKALAGSKALAGKALYGLGCIFASGVLAASAAGYYVQKATDRVGTSPVLAGGKSTGALNILIMGLESRTYWDGTSINHHLGVILNTGTSSNNNGGEATNTLILIHVFAGGQKAVGFSIPRDDYVTLYGTLGYNGTPKQNKIDAAYNAAFQQELINDQKDHPGWTRAQDNIDANHAGQQATVDTVEALTGVTIDKFAELNLIGFYELANAFGGVEACINRWPGGAGYAPGANLSDPVAYNPVEHQQAGSGFAGRAGLQHLSPAQTLAFVRQRNNLPQGDIDRTQRQQAVIDYVLHQLKTEGMLADVGKLGSLMSVAQDYLQTSAGWNLLEFAGELDALTTGNLHLSTLPSTTGPDIPGIGFVNNVDVAAIQAQVQQAFNAPDDGITTPVPATGTVAPHGTTRKPGATPKPSAGSTPGAGKTPSTRATTPAYAPSSVTIDAYNSNQTTHGLAASLSAALVKKGYKAGLVRSYPTPLPLTTITYGAGVAAKTAAGLIAKDFSLTATASSAVPAGHVQVIIGGSVTFLPAGIIGQPTASPTTSAPAQGPTLRGDSNTSASGATTALQKQAQAEYGIPCEY